MKTNKGWVDSISRGKGGIAYWKYYTVGLRPFTTKAMIVEAINIGVILYRQERATKVVEKFNYKTLDFEKVKK